MKNILITGANSYIGTSLGKWLERYPEKYSINSISLRDDAWRKKDFSEYDVVVHIAGIAHVKETKSNANLYFKVNRDLAIETAKKAKCDGVSQFIIISSMSVYGIDIGVIDSTTVPKPKSNYGKSKLQADEEISRLVDINYTVTIIRPPMVYGKECKGNYQSLAKYAINLPVFPDIKNKRSMIYIDNLTEFIKQCIDKRKCGILLPQNNEYVCTSQMVKLIAEAHGRKIRFTRIFNSIIRQMKIDTISKVFGDLVYMKDEDSDYEVCNFKESIYATEN